MKKLFLSFLLTVLLISSVSASQLSYDKSGFAPVSSIIFDAAYDIRYYSDNNFTGSRIRGYKAPVPYLTKEALRALSIAANNLRKQGYRILIFDAYRPQKAVDHFVEWINNPKDMGEKRFFPELSKQDLIKGDYIMPKSGHSRGSTVDLTIITIDGASVDMGGTFDLFSEISHPDYKNLTKLQKKNREILKVAMEKAGFKGLDSEWWHFSLKNEPYPDTYFNFDIE